MAGDTRFHVQRYISEGFSVLPIPKGSKAPDVKDWVNRTFTIEDFKEDDNIGVRLGEPSGHLTDIDLDCPQAVIAAKYLLPATERKHGRPGTGDSHYFYICEGADSEKWCDVDGKVILEIRSTGGQTVIPPSIHPSGEQLYWAARRTPTNVVFVALRRDARSCATGALLGRHWPATGSRHDCAKHAAGFLAARDLDLGTICNIIKAACEAAGDNESEDRVRAAADTVKTFAAGGKTTGGPNLEDAVGKEVVALLVKWYGGNSAVHDKVIDEMNVNRFGTRVGKDYVYGLEEEHAVVFQPARALFEEFSHQKVQVGTKTRGDQKGEPIFKTKFEIWREHPKKRTYRKVTFAPPPAVADPLDYNLWKGFAVSPLQPEGGIAGMSEDGLRAWTVEHCLPKCNLFFDLVFDVICSGNPEHFAYMVNLLALTVKFPGIPSEVAVVLKGDQGAGKGTFVRTFGRGLFGRHFVHLDRTEQLAGKFNASLSGKVVVFADEAFFAGDKSSLGSLKRLITEPTLSIERKGIDSIEEPNFIHLFMATNEKWAHQAGIKERRFFTVQVSNAHLQDHAYFNAINEQMAPGGEGLRSLLSYLVMFDVDHDMVRRVPKTDELRAQQEQSLPLDLRFFRQALRKGELGDGANWPEYTYEGEIYNDFLRYCDIIKFNRQRPDVDDLMKTLNPFLGTHGERKQREDSAGKRRWMRRLRPLAEARAIFDELIGTKGEWETDEEPGTNGSGEPPKDLPF